LCINCNSKAINSHLLQKNGILNNVAEKDHVMELKLKDYFNVDKSGLYRFEKIGINKAISQYLFCNRHDTELFKPIENYPIDFSDKKVQLLFSYRSVCGELRKKQVDCEKFKRILKSNLLKPQMDASTIKNFENAIIGFDMGIRDLMTFKDIFENAIANQNPSSFTFETLTYDPIKVSAAAIFSPIKPSFFSTLRSSFRKKPLNCIFINLIPQKENLYLIIGFHNEYKDDWIVNYVNSWKNLDKENLEKKITDLIATRVNTWCVAPSTIESSSSNTMKMFLEYWNENQFNLSSEQNLNLNLFADL
jgi:hypothetical protein